jgi:hypothetical protein
MMMSFNFFSGNLFASLFSLSIGLHKLKVFINFAGRQSQEQRAEVIKSKDDIFVIYHPTRV